MSQDQKSKAEKPQKPLRVVRADNSALVRFEWVGGGEIPAELSGRYTNFTVAKEAAVAYFNPKGRDVEIVDQSYPEDESPLTEKQQRQTSRTFDAL